MKRRKRLKSTLDNGDSKKILRIKKEREEQNDEEVVLGKVWPRQQCSTMLPRTAGWNFPWPWSTGCDHTFPMSPDGMLSSVQAISCERWSVPIWHPRPSYIHSHNLPMTCHTGHSHTHTQPETAIISNSLLSSSYAQQLLNFGGNFQKILSVSLSEIACPDAPYKKILNLEKTQNISKGKCGEITRAVSCIQLSVLQRFQGLKC